VAGLLDGFDVDVEEPTARDGVAHGLKEPRPSPGWASCRDMPRLAAEDANGIVDTVGLKMSLLAAAEAFIAHGLGRRPAGLLALTLRTVLGGRSLRLTPDASTVAVGATPVTPTTAARRCQRTPGPGSLRLTLTRLLLFPPRGRTPRPLLSSNPGPVVITSWG
jgi:hypothetical protein